MKLFLMTLLFFSFVNAQDVPQASEGSWATVSDNCEDEIKNLDLLLRSNGLYRSAIIDARRKGQNESVSATVALYNERAGSFVSRMNTLCNHDALKGHLLLAYNQLAQRFLQVHPRHAQSFKCLGKR